MGRKVAVYRRPQGLFGQQVEDILSSERVPFESIEIDDKAEQERIGLRHGALSFPLVLVDGRYVGGFAHITRLHAEGRLREVLLGEESATDPDGP